MELLERLDGMEQTGFWLPMTVEDLHIGQFTGVQMLRSGHLLHQTRSFPTHLLLDKEMQ
jgi:hypothetical protein